LEKSKNNEFAPSKFSLTFWEKHFPPFGAKAKIIEKNKTKKFPPSPKFA
jgi:hypothetical protein